MTKPEEFVSSLYRQRYPDLRQFNEEAIWNHWKDYGQTEGRNGSGLNSRQDFLQHLKDFEYILEIGPWDRPSLEFLKAISGLNIDYADYFSEEELRKLAEQTPGRNAELVPKIKYVLSNGYTQIVDKYDAIVSHHCIEHQPDLIQHLLDIHKILKPGGSYWFTIPNCEMCFDHYIPKSNIVDLIVAHEEKRSRPSLKSVIQQLCFIQENWKDGNNPYEITNKEISAKIKSAVSHYNSVNYADAHCWQFTSMNFKKLIIQLAKLGYLPEDISINTYGMDGEFCGIISF